MIHVVEIIEEIQEIVIIHPLVVVVVERFMLLNQEINSIIDLIKTDFELSNTWRILRVLWLSRSLLQFFFRVQKNELRGFFPFLLIKHIFLYCKVYIKIVFFHIIINTKSEKKNLYFKTFFLSIPFHLCIHFRLSFRYLTK